MTERRDRNELYGILTGTSSRAGVRFERTYDTDPLDLWEAVTEPGRLQRWMATVTGELRPGGTFALAFDDGEVSGCRLLTCEPPTAFSWQWDLHSGPSRVDVQVRAAGSRARLILVHEDLATTSAAEYSAGWHAHLDGLADHLAGREPGDWNARFAAARPAYVEAAQQLVPS